MTLPANRKIVSGDHGRMGHTTIKPLSIDSVESAIDAAVEFVQTTYNYTEVANEEEVTGTGDGGYDAYEYGCKHIEGHMECVWDADVQYFAGADTAAEAYDDDFPYLDPHGHYEFRGYVNSLAELDGPYLYIANMRINNLAVTIPAKGKIVFSFDFKSSGAYTLPVGVVSEE